MTHAAQPSPPLVDRQEHVIAGTLPRVHRQAFLMRRSGASWRAIGHALVIRPGAARRRVREAEQRVAFLKMTTRICAILEQRREPSAVWPVWLLPWPRVALEVFDRRGVTSLGGVSTLNRFDLRAEGLDDAVVEEVARLLETVGLVLGSPPPFAADDVERLERDVTFMVWSAEPELRARLVEVLRPRPTSNVVPLVLPAAFAR